MEKFNPLWLFLITSEPLLFFPRSDSIIVWIIWLHICIFLDAGGLIYINESTGEIFTGDVLDRDNSTYGDTIVIHVQVRWLNHFPIWHITHGQEWTPFWVKGHREEMFTFMKKYFIVCYA